MVRLTTLIHTGVSCAGPPEPRSGPAVQRRSPLRRWVFNPKVADQFWCRFGRPQIDLFASEENATCSRLFSVKAGDRSMGMDALAHSCPSKLLYAFPPMELILPTLERVRLQGLSVLMVAPAWGTWRSEIILLL